MLELPSAMTAYICFLAAVSGLCMGSFLNCFAYRYSIGEPVSKGRSKCALCGHRLGAADLVPVFSWLLLRGRCRYCGGSISARYVLAEVICGAAYASVWLKYGLSVAALEYLVLASLLFAAAFADLHGGLIPDRLIIVGTATAFFFAGFFAEENAAVALLKTLINGFSVSLPLLLVVLVLDKLMKRETMGGGDIKLMFLIGLYFDWKLNILIMILACIIGLAYALLLRPASNPRGGSSPRGGSPHGGSPHGGEGAFVFGPCLALAAWCAMLWGARAVDWYLGLFL